MPSTLPNLLVIVICCLTLFSCKTDPTANSPIESIENKQSEAGNITKDLNVSIPTILFYGNSLTAGLGIDPDDGFVNLIQNNLTEKGKKYKCINAGLSGETTAGGKNRINWVLKNNNPSIFVLELGGNDGLRGIDPENSRQNLQGIIDAVKASNSETKILLAGMEAPPNMGADYTASFRGIYPSLAKENGIALIPFLLDRVGGIKELNQADGIHPNEKGQIIVAENIWTYLEPMI